MMNFLSNMLRDDVSGSLASPRTLVQSLSPSVLQRVLHLQGGFEYKRAIVDCIISIIEENPESKETGLAHLCEFIEDCEHTVLATKILHLLGKEGPRTPQPSKYIRFIFNRVVLESEAVRAGKQGSDCAAILHQVISNVGVSPMFPCSFDHLTCCFPL